VAIGTTRYAETIDGVHVAYPVIGGGPHDLVFVPATALSHVEGYWGSIRLPFTFRGKPSRDDMHLHRSGGGA
jgi:hypothetical protein